MNNTFKLLGVAAIAVALGTTGCKKSYLDTNPTNQISPDDLFKTTTSAYTALNGIHAFMIDNKPATGAANDANWGTKAIDLESDVMGNDMVCSGSNYDWFDFHYKYVMTQSATYWGPFNIWIHYYKIINNANSILDNIDGAQGPDDQKNDIKGQALAYRAWGYSNLAIFFQHTYMSSQSKPGVPIYTKGTTAESVGAGRGTVQDVYDRALADINESITLLSASPVDHSDNKSNISAAAAYGIKARMCLTMGKYAEARDAAGAALTNAPLMSATAYKEGFNSVDNPEWIWGSKWTSTQYNDLSILCFMSFVDNESPGYAQVGATRKITKALYTQIPATDVRKEVWDAGNFIQKKFRVKNKEGFEADYVYMRSAEMYLIGAEAAYRNGDGDAAAQDFLTPLMEARDPSYLPTNAGATLLAEILLQRRIELWGEGFAYRDIVRLSPMLPNATSKALDRPTGAGNHAASIATVISLPRESDRFVFKIPQRELDANPALSAADQNP